MTNLQAKEHSDAPADVHELFNAVVALSSQNQDLLEQVRLLEAVIENFPGGLSIFDKNMEMVLCSDGQKALLEYPDSLFENGNPSLEDLFRFNAERREYGPGDPEEHVSRRLALARKRTPHSYERTRPNGTTVAVRGVPIEGGGFLTTYMDVTEQRRAQALVAHMAHHDGLTDLPNRSLFADRLKQAIALAKRAGLIAVHYLDIDGFKPVNDTLGHKAGDELLTGIAQRLRQTVREHDTAARLGGDEFGILQTGIHSPKDAAILAQRIVDQIARPMVICGKQVTVGVSIGVAIAPLDGTLEDEVLIKADRALYRSKATGRGKFTFANASLIT